MIVKLSMADETGLRPAASRRSRTTAAVARVAAADAMNGAATKANGASINDNNLHHDYKIGAGQFELGASNEKMNIIGPELVSTFDMLRASHRFYFEKDKVIDIGCGPGLLMMPLLTHGINVEGFDPTEEMIQSARASLEGAVFGDGKDKNKVKLTNSIDTLAKESYAAGMLNFVTQTCETKKELKTLFQQAHGLIKDGGVLIVTGAHPEHLHFKHANCEYDVEDSSKMVDGQRYTGRIISDRGTAIYHLSGDYFWHLRTMQKVAEGVGFVHEDTRKIADKGTYVRKASPVPPYFMMTLRRNGIHPK